MADQHLEVERKYSVPDDAPPPSGLGDVGHVADVRELELVAEYLDTEDLALASRGTSLRRRTGGDDDGWHLKTTDGPDRRRELRAPPGGPEDGVPEQLLDAVRAVVRDRRLVRVAVVRNRRVEHRLVDGEDRDLATVCDDHVTATAWPDAEGGGTVHVWREWELELADGREPGLLDRLEEPLLAAGAGPAPTASKLAHVLGREPEVVGEGRHRFREGSAGALVHGRLTELVHELQAQDAAVRADLPHGVHRLRVACRRIRSVLTSSRPLLAEGSTDHLRSDMRLLGQVLGRARDAEVMGRRLVDAAHAEPAELVLGPVPARIEADLRRDHARAMDGVREALGSDRYLRLLADLDAFLDDLPLGPRGHRPARRTVARLVRDDSRRLRTRVRAARSAGSQERDAALHEVRKKAKRLRYTAELAAPVGGDGADRVRRRAKAVQKALGDHQDSVVAREVLRRLGGTSHLAGENGFTFGLLLGTERLRAERARARAEDAWGRLPGPKDAGRRVRRG